MPPRKPPKEQSIQEVKTPPLTQLSKKQLLELTRPYAKRAIEVTVELMEKADNDSVRLGAAKVLLNKVLPDLKAVEIESESITKVLLDFLQPKNTPPSAS